jgi:hypothetical protein
MISKLFKKPFILFLASIAFLFVTALIGTPYLIDMGLERWIASQGPEIGHVENVDFNPFSGRLSLDNLVVETKGGRTLNISHAYLVFSWKQLFKKQLYLDELILRDTFLVIDRLEGTGFRVGGLILRELIGAEEKAQKPGWEVGINRFEMQDARFDYDTPELTATYFIDQYTLTGLETWNKQKPVQMELAGRINESPVHIKAEIKPLDVIRSWKGSIVLENGSLDLLAKVRGLEKYAPSGTMDIDLQLAAQMQEDGSITIDTEGAVALNKLYFQYEGNGLKQEKINWQGHIAGSKAAAQELALEVDGQLAGNDLALGKSEDSLQFLLGAISWQGKAEIRQQQEDFLVTMEAELDGSNLTVRDGKNNVDLLGLEKFTLKGIQVASSENIRVSQVDLQAVRLVEKMSMPDRETKEAVVPLLFLGAVEITNTSLEGGNILSIEGMSLKDLQADIQRSKDGGWQIMPALPKSAELPRKAPDSGAGKMAAAEPLRLRLNNLQAGGASYINFADESLQRPFRSTFYFREFQVNGLDTADSGTPAQFMVGGQVDDYGTVAFDGTLKPSEKPLTLELKGKIGSLDMVPFSTYAGRTIGYKVTRGQMDADIALSIAKGNIDGNFALKLRNLEVAQVDSDKVPEIDNQIDVPLGTALAMLRNKKDEINLNLELQGDTQNPEFGIQDAINQALAKAMKFAAVNYLKYTLQPFGTYIAIAEVVGKAGKEVAKIRLDPIIFPVAEIVLTESANQYLEKVRDVLTNRPKLRIELCGKAVAKDRVALMEKRQAAMKTVEEKNGAKQGAAMEEMSVSDEILLDFARERAKLVKESLVKQHSIDHQRIYLCLPEIDESPDKEAHVELLLE